METVGAIEQGKGRVPPEHWMEWAKLLGQDPRRFAERMLYWYDSHAHYAVFGEVHPHEAESLPRESSKKVRARPRQVA
jgi:hypothetical protein